MNGRPCAFVPRKSRCKFARLLIFGSSARTPSKECGRCLLTKFALAQFTARLFWRLGNQWHLAFNIFDAVTTHTVAGGYTRPIHTPHNALSLNTRTTQQSRQPTSENRRLCLSAPNNAARALEKHSIVGAVGTDNAGAVLPRFDPAIIHPRFAVWYKLGLTG